MGIKNDKTILIVDDAEDTRIVLENYLEGLKGVEVRSFPGAESVLEYLRAWGKVDLILLDLMMPDVSGFELLDMMRTGGLQGASVRWRDKASPEIRGTEMKIADNLLNKRASAVPVIIISARKNTQDILKARGYKVAAYLGKPIEENILLNRVKEVLDI